MIKKIKKIYYQFLAILLKNSDRLASKIFLNSKFNALVEMGVHQGEIAKAVKEKGVDYIGYEANPFNIEKYDLKKLNVKNFAVIPKDYSNENIEINIPIRNKGDDYSSGKSSLLKKNLDGWYDCKSVKVKTIKVSEMPYLNIKSSNVGVWIDIEGLSTKIADEISQIENVKFIHFENDFINTGYEDQIFSDVKTINKNFYLLKFRTSHDQYNYYGVREKTWLIIFYNFISKAHNALIEIFLLPFYLSKKFK